MSTDTTPASSRAPTPGLPPSSSALVDAASQSDPNAATLASSSMKQQPPAQSHQSVHQRKIALKGEDAWKRMNFLYQSSHVLTMQNSQASSNLSRFYLINLKKIAAKMVMRMSDERGMTRTIERARLKNSSNSEFFCMTDKHSRSDPSVKNSICKRCGTLLVPGQTADLDILSAGDAEELLSERARNFPASNSLPASTTTANDMVAASSAGVTDVPFDAEANSSSKGTKKRLRRHRSSRCNVRGPVHIVSVCRICHTRKRIHTKPQSPSPSTVVSISPSQSTAGVPPANVVNKSPK